MKVIWKKKKEKKLKVWEILNFEYFLFIKNSIKLPPKKRVLKGKKFSWVTKSDFRLMGQATTLECVMF
jgi:hypothetical protein